MPHTFSNDSFLPEGTSKTERLIGGGRNPNYQRPTTFRQRELRDLEIKPIGDYFNVSDKAMQVIDGTLDLITGAGQLGLAYAAATGSAIASGGLAAGLSVATIAAVTPVAIGNISGGLAKLSNVGFNTDFDTNKADFVEDVASKNKLTKGVYDFVDISSNLYSTGKGVLTIEDDLVKGGREVFKNTDKMSQEMI